MNECTVYRTLTFPAWLLCVLSLIGTAVYWVTVGMVFVARGQLFEIALSVMGSAVVLWVTPRSMGYQPVLDLWKYDLLVAE